MDDLSEDYVPPSRIWRQLPLDRRMEAARAFWESSDEASRNEQLEAVVTLARHMKFRPQSMQAMPLDKRGKYLAQLPAMTDSITARALAADTPAPRRPR